MSAPAALDILVRARRRVTRRAWDWIDGRNSIPFWALWIWPRLHWCAEFDDLLVGMERPEDCPYLCDCVRWPRRFWEHPCQAIPAEPF